MSSAILLWGQCGIGSCLAYRLANEGRWLSLVERNLAGLQALAKETVSWTVRDGPNDASLRLLAGACVMDIVGWPGVRAEQALRAGQAQRRLAHETVA